MKDINSVSGLLAQLRQVWDIQQDWLGFYDRQKGHQLADIEASVLEEQHKRLSFSTRKFTAEMRTWGVSEYLAKKVAEFRAIPAIVTDLTNRAMRGRHWA